MNPMLFTVLAALVAQTGDGYTVMDYLKVGGGIFLAGLTIYRVGDVKMILYVLFIACVVIGGVLIIPQFQGSPIRGMILEFLSELPTLIEQFLGDLL